jgi:RNA polymerase sigma-70 factor (ECF subfamily)
MVIIGATDCQNKSDKELVQLSLQNQDYFLYLMKKYEAPLTRYIRRISNLDQDTIADILQEVFLKVYQNLNEFDQSLKFSSWIYRIAHNQLMSYYRKLKARPRIVTLEDDSKILDNLISNIDIEKEINNQLNRKVILRILKKLDFKYSEVLILRFLEDKSYEEISDILKKPIGTVATLINRAKKEFKKLLDKQNIEL